VATIRRRPRSDGSTAYNVTWILGGRRGGESCSETFNSDVSAKKFKALVDANGQQWPPGWIKGEGFVGDTGPAPVQFADWALDWVEHLSGIYERTRYDYQRDIVNHLIPAFGDLDVRDTVDFGPRQIAVWVNRMAAAGKAPKTISNIHGILYSIMQAAAETDPPLRSSNPCAKTRLPRLDHQTHDEMVFLTGPEFALLHRELADVDPHAADLAYFLVTTGLRWSEATAVQVGDIDITPAGATVRVQRAWKRQRDGSHKLGPPKTRRSRRTIQLPADVVDMLMPYLVGKPRGAYVFTNAQGSYWRHANYYNRRWWPAVQAAIRCSQHQVDRDDKNYKKLVRTPCYCPGTLEKVPRIHDLRHTYASWLINYGNDLMRVQRSMGHQSITTTVDRYGHLTPDTDQRVTAAIEAELPSLTHGPDVGLVVPDLDADVERPVQ
jgi:integrase